MSGKKKVIIYQMGKVASYGIATSLSKIKELEVIHMHHLNSGYTKELNEIKKTKGWMVRDNPNAVKSLLSKIKNEDELFIITLVREPIGRNISAYFQNLDFIYREKNVHDRLSQDDLLNGFINKYPHSIPITWFDKEPNETLGIDVYKYEFPRKEGALIINEGKYHLLVMRYDIDDSVKQKYIEEILDMSNISITRDNIGYEKPYSSAYKSFINNVRFPDAYLSAMLDSKYARHFFDESELDSLKERWAIKTDNAFN